MALRMFRMLLKFALLLDCIRPYKSVRILAFAKQLANIRDPVASVLPARSRLLSLKCTEGGVPAGWGLRTDAPRAYLPFNNGMFCSLEREAPLQCYCQSIDWARPYVSSNFCK